MSGSNCATRPDKVNTPHPPYGLRHPRTLFVVSSESPPPARRIKSIQELGLKHQMSAGLFLFARHDELLEGDFLTYEWQNLRGQPVRLLA